MTDDLVLQTVPLGLHWPTVDPFLFCAHHDDAYPPGTEEMAPAASLEGRSLGMDFEGRDGWRMYHGTVIPGFPQHPHRGFETITYVRNGFCDHADSLGAAARFGEGDVQWITAGAGIVHSEMFPLLDRIGPNRLELFQIWLNLPAADKMSEPHFTMLWADEIPRIRRLDGDGRIAEVTVITGSFGATASLRPPPDSWAARSDSDVAVWHIGLEPGATIELPPARDQRTVRTVYVFDGSARIGDDELPENTGALVRSTRIIQLGTSEGAEILVLQGRPIGEPVVQQGPFVMNDEAGLRRTFLDYQRTGFGGWPWSVDGPAHPADRGRFAVYPDGRTETRG